MNWIERKAASEKQLREHSRDIWNAAIIAVDNCLRSFKEHYSDLATVSQEHGNGHLLIVTIKFSDAQLLQRQVRIAFNEDKPEISVLVDGGPALLYPIKSDASHSFLFWREKEISPDDFSQWALRSPLFIPPSPKKSRSGSPTASHTAWS
jgi:hypothetical protein